MAPAAPLRNVAIVGASGRLGPHILRAVQADPAFKVTVITRESSTATFPGGTTVVRVGDDYPEEQMEKTFQGQDAVVLSLSYAGEHHRSALTKAAIRAGVRRVVASGYGGNDENKEAQRVFPITANKAAMVQELRSLEQDGWSWTSVCCGLFFDFCIRAGFFGLDPKAHTATIWDDGTATFSATTLRTIGVAVARVLSNPEATANRYVYVSSFETCMNDILAAEQKATGTTAADWTVERVSTDAQITHYMQESAAATEFMPRMMAMAKLALAINLKPEFQQDFRKLGKLDNELLGIQQESVGEVVARALKEASMA